MFDKIQRQGEYIDEINRRLNSLKVLLIGNKNEPVENADMKVPECLDDDIIKHLIDLEYALKQLDAIENYLKGEMKNGE